MPIPDFAKAGVRVKPPENRVFCPRHRAWEVVVEDKTLCEWCCEPLPCDLHPDESWVDNVTPIDEGVVKEETFVYIDLDSLED